MRGYVNSFQKLVMQIPNMMDGEKLVHFNEDLNATLHREVIKDNYKTYEAFV